MNVFNSLGSNYDWGFALRALFTFGSKKNHDDLAGFLENKYDGKTILVYKGREALELALILCDLPPQSGVLINGFTCFAVYNAIVNAGHRVVYADVDVNLNFRPDTLKKLLKNNPTIRVVIIQNTLGFPCQIDEIDKICKENNLILIEDLAHSVGAVYESGQEAGMVGDFVALSFSQDKMIDGVSGGALIIKNKKYQKKEIPALKNIPFAPQLKDHLYPILTLIIRKTYPIGLGKIIHFLLKKLSLLSTPMAAGEKGVFHNLSGWYCSLVKIRFKELELNLASRKAIAHVYHEQLRLLAWTASIRLLSSGSNLRYFFLTNNRRSLINYLINEGIFVSDTWYDAPIAPKSYMKMTDYDRQCSKAEEIANTIINLPTHPNISNMQAHQIAQKVKIWLQSQQEK